MGSAPLMSGTCACGQTQRLKYIWASCAAGRLFGRGGGVVRKKQRATSGKCTIHSPQQATKAARYPGQSHRQSMVKPPV